MSFLSQASEKVEMKAAAKKIGDRRMFLYFPELSRKGREVQIMPLDDVEGDENDKLKPAFDVNCIL
jgi:hypothetical protein